MWPFVSDNGLPQLGASVVLFFGLVLPLNCYAQDHLPEQMVTNIFQFQTLVDREPGTKKFVHLEGIVCAADLHQGMLTLSDDSGVALIEMDPQDQTLLPGQKILIEGECSGGRGGASLKIGNLYLVADGANGMREQIGSLSLKNGKYPISVEWVDGGRLSGVRMFYEGPHLVRQSIPDSAFYHGVVDVMTGVTNWIHGLDYRAYEGQWSTLPDFRQLPFKKTGTVKSLDFGVKTRGQYVGLEFDGYVELPQDGLYTFFVAPQGRDQLFIEHPQIKVLEMLGVPSPHRIVPGQITSDEERSQWAEVEGKITFVSKTQSGGLDLELSSEAGKMYVEVATGSSALLLGSRVRITGICTRAYALDGQIISGRMWVPNLDSVELLEVASELWKTQPVLAIRELSAMSLSNSGRPMTHIMGRVQSIGPGHSMLIADETGEISLQTSQQLPRTTGDFVEVLGIREGSGSNTVLTSGFYQQVEHSNKAIKPLPILNTAGDVKRLKREDALQGYPVKIRGVITWSGGSGFVVQDSTMGVFVDLVDSKSAEARQLGEYCEVEGVTTARFTPMVIAGRVNRLGFGALPAPVRPTWDQLMNGTLDTQYVEVQGVVTAVESTKIILLTHDGEIQVDLPDMQSEELKSYENALVSIRGCLWAIKDEVTHVLKVGQIQIHAPLISVVQAAPTDPFSAPLKRASDLLLFDAKASAFERVKVAGQIVHSQGGEFFLMDGVNGLRFITKSITHLKIGDQVEVIGFPLLDGPSPVLREAVVRKTGQTYLPAAKLVLKDAILNGDYDSTLVKIDAQLINITDDPKDQIYGLQSGQHTFVAKLDKELGFLRQLPVGSQLELTGVYAGIGGDRTAGRDIDSFELLLNSDSDVKVLARPPWWTVRRMLAMIGFLVGILAFTVVWIGLLHRQVEQRSNQLKNEILVRQQTEHQRAIEAERSRIARDLHDDLGASLTEISMLADAGAGYPPALERAGKRFRTIGDKARAIVNALDVIVWLVNPRKDALPFLLSYIGSYTDEYLSASGINCRLQIPSDIPAVRLTAQFRHDLFLAVKEALHNVVRHAHATEVTVETIANETHLTLVITDNGQGFNVASQSQGNGLSNLRERLSSMGGQFQITSTPNTGTVVAFSIILPINKELQ